MWRRAPTRCWGRSPVPPASTACCIEVPGGEAPPVCGAVPALRHPHPVRYDYTETTPKNLYDQDHDPILQDLKRLFTYRGLDGCRMRNGFHFEYKGLHMTYHKTLPYSTIAETGDDGVTYDILYDILIKQNGEIHSDWTGVKMDVEKYRRVTFEPMTCGCWRAP